MPGIEIELSINDRATPKIKALAEVTSRTFNRVGDMAGRSSQRMKQAFESAVHGVEEQTVSLQRAAASTNKFADAAERAAEAQEIMKEKVAEANISLVKQASWPASAALRDQADAARTLGEAEAQLSQVVAQTNQQLSARPIVVDRSVAAMEKQIEAIRSAMALNRMLSRESPFLFPPMAHRGRYDPERQMRESLQRYQQALRTAQLNETAVSGRSRSPAGGRTVNLTFNIQGTMSDDEKRRLVRETILPELQRIGIRGGVNLMVN